jgi:hypothetical protein
VIFIVVHKKICSKCGKEKNSTTGFYKIFSWAYADERMPFCKECIDEKLAISDTTDFMDDNFIHNFQSILLDLNKPFIYDWYIASIEEVDRKSSKSNRSVFFGVYNKKLQLIERKKGYSLTWLDSEFSPTEESLDDKKVNTNVVITNVLHDRERLVHFWGKGLSDEAYEWLDTEYTDYASRYDVDTKTLENTIKELCLTQWDIRKAREANSPVDKLEKTFQDLMGTANLKPVQETGANSIEQETFGTLIKKYENEKPIPDPLPEWADVDGIRSKITTWFTGHMSKMLGMNNELTTEYDKEMKKYSVERLDPSDDQDDAL